MKKLILLILGIISCISLLTEAKAAEYTPMVREGVEWTYRVRIRIYYAFPGQGAYLDTLFYKLKFEGDSVINGVTYKKLYRTATPSNIYVSSKSLLALMREHDKKVYRRPIKEGSYFDTYLSSPLYFEEFDQLVYDFNVGTGENLVEPCISWDAFKLLNSSEILLEDNSKRNLHVVSNDDFSMEVLEGAGCISRDQGNLLFPVVRKEARSEQQDYYFTHSLLCQKDEKGNMLFKSPYYDWLMEVNEAIGVNKVTEPKTLGYQIENRTIKGDGAGRVFDIMGTLLHEGNLDGYTFPASGIYIISTKDSTGKVFVQ